MNLPVRPIIRDIVRSPLRTSMDRGGGRPQPPSANMVAWFRKGVGITQAANAVSQWNDQSGNARHYTQGTGAAQPTLQGGLTILFDGTSDFLRTGVFVLAQPYTRYLRMRQITWTSSEYLCDGIGANTGHLIQQTSSPTLSLMGAISNSALAINTWGSVAMVVDGASSVLRIDATEVAGNSGVGNPGGLTLGADGGAVPSVFGNIEVAEEIVYSVAHDASTRAAVIAYLNTL